MEVFGERSFQKWKFRGWKLGRDLFTSNLFVFLAEAYAFTPLYYLYVLVRMAKI